MNYFVMKLLLLNKYELEIKIKIKIRKRKRKMRKYGHKDLQLLLSTREFCL